MAKITSTQPLFSTTNVAVCILSTPLCHVYYLMQPLMMFYAEGSGNVFRFRVGPDYYWIAGSGPGGSLTASEEEQFYRAMEAAGVERDD